jgi:hypothetical protein
MRDELVGHSSAGKDRLKLQDRPRAERDPKRLHEEPQQEHDGAGGESGVARADAGGEAGGNSRPWMPSSGSPPSVHDSKAYGRDRIDEMWTPGFNPDRRAAQTKDSVSPEHDSYSTAMSVMMPRSLSSAVWLDAQHANNDLPKAGGNLGGKTSPAAAAAAAGKRDGAKEMLGDSDSKARAKPAMTIVIPAAATSPDASPSGAANVRSPSSFSGMVAATPGKGTPSAGKQVQQQFDGSSPLGSRPKFGIGASSPPAQARFDHSGSKGAVVPLLDKSATATKEEHDTNPTAARGAKSAGLGQTDTVKTPTSPDPHSRLRSSDGNQSDAAGLRRSVGLGDGKLDPISPVASALSLSVSGLAGKQSSKVSPLEGGTSSSKPARPPGIDLGVPDFRDFVNNDQKRSRSRSPAQGLPRSPTNESSSMGAWGGGGDALVRGTESAAAAVKPRKHGVPHSGVTRGDGDSIHGGVLGHDHHDDSDGAAAAASATGKLSLSHLDLHVKFSGGQMPGSRDKDSGANQEAAAVVRSDRANAASTAPHSDSEQRTAPEHKGAVDAVAGSHPAVKLRDDVTRANAEMSRLRGLLEDECRRRRDADVEARMLRVLAEEERAVREDAQAAADKASAMLQQERDKREGCEAEMRRLRLLCEEERGKKDAAESHIRMLRDEISGIRDRESEQDGSVERARALLEQERKRRESAESEAEAMRTRVAERDARLLEKDAEMERERARTSDEVCC